MKPTKLGISRIKPHKNSHVTYITRMTKAHAALYTKNKEETSTPIH